MSLDAILLAGGRGSRLGGAVKPLLELDGVTLLQRAVTAATDAGARRVTVVAAVLDPALAVHWVREDPPYSGPAAAVVEALADSVADDADWMLLLACDLPRAGEAVARLTAALPLLPADADGVCLGDASGRPQWLAGLYRTAALRGTAGQLRDAGADAPVRALMADLAITVIAGGDASHDIDTWDDYEREKEHLNG